MTNLLDPLDMDHYEGNIFSRVTGLEKTLEDLERFSLTKVDFDAGVFQLGRLKIVWGYQDVTPSWTGATDHSYSGAHSIILAGSFSDASYVVSVSIRDSLSARSAWCMSVDPDDEFSFDVYLAAPDAAESNVTAIRVYYIAIGLVS